MKSVKSPELEVRDLLRREVLLMQQLFDTLQRELQMLLTHQHGAARCLMNQRTVVARTCVRIRDQRVRRMEQLAATRGLPLGRAALLADRGTSAQLFDPGTGLQREVAHLDAELVTLEGKISSARGRTDALLAPRRY